MGANFVTSSENQLLGKPGRRLLCQMHRYQRFRRRSGQHCAYRKLCLRNCRPTVDFSTSFIEKPGQRSRLSSRRCSISLTLSEEYFGRRPPSKPGVQSCTLRAVTLKITENARIRNSSFRGAIDNFFSSKGTVTHCESAGPRRCSVVHNGNLCGTIEAMQVQDVIVDLRPSWHSVNLHDVTVRPTGSKVKKYLKKWSGLPQSANTVILLWDKSGQAGLHKTSIVTYWKQMQLVRLDILKHSADVRCCRL